MGQAMESAPAPFSAPVTGIGASFWADINYVNALGGLGPANASANRTAVAASKASQALTLAKRAVDAATAALMKCVEQKEGGTIV